jgi:hypothetical protein
MRAEEGDETVKDYAIEGKQTLGRINESQRARNPVVRAVRKVGNFFGFGQNPPRGAHR